MQITSFTILALALTAYALPIRREGLQSRQDEVAIQNGQDAIDLNEKFKTLTVDSPCTTGDDACINGQFAKCDAGSKFAILGCAAGTVCAAIPLENQRGTLVNCVRQEDVNARIRATGVLEDRNNNRRQGGRGRGGGRGGGRGQGGRNGANAGNNAAAGNAANNAATPPDAAAAGNAGNNAATPPDAAGAAAGNAADAAPGNAADAAAGNAADAAAGNAADAAAGNADTPPDPAAQDAAAGNNADDSLTLDPSVIAKGFENDGQDVPAEGQVASLTSKNNFINFCVGKTITDGKQVAEGSCNPAPMGDIPANTNMPSCKFVNPTNNSKLKADTPFVIQLAVNQFETGNFVNAQQNYFAAPQQLNAQGIIRGHSHVVIEKLASLDDTKPLDPLKFEFFKGLNSAAVDGILEASVDDGLPAGFYKLSSINTASNHQPVLVPVAQHGSLDDVVYFTVE